MPITWRETERDFRQFLLTSDPPHAAGTAKTYVNNFSIFWRWCARWETAPHDVDAPAVRDWVSERLRTCGSSRVHNDLAALRWFYRYLREIRYRADDPTAGVRMKRGKKLPTKPLAVAEVDLLLHACRTERDRLLILLMAYTGLRVSEVAGLEAEAIDWQECVLRVRGKGDKERLIPVGADLLQRLHAFCGMFPAGAVFLSVRERRRLSEQQIRKILYEIGAEAKVEHVHPHRLRATFGTEYLAQFRDIQALQYLMGHEDSETTSRYTEYGKARRARDQMKGFRLLDDAG